MMTEIEPQDSLAARIDSTKCSSYLKLIRVTSTRNAPELSEIELPKRSQNSYSSRHSQSQDLKSGKLKRTCPKIRNDGVVVVRGNVERWVEMSYNQHEVPLLTQEHNISLLYDKFVHEQGRWGVSATANKVRARFWIIGLHRIAGEEHQAQLRSVQEIRP